MGTGNVFDFKVTSTTPTNARIPYEITARMKSDSTLDPSAVKAYLTTVNGASEEEILLDQYSNLTQTSVLVPEATVEKTIYKGTVPVGSNYEKNFRLRMWISEDTEFSDGSMNGKTFAITVNVYANAEIVSLPTDIMTPATSLSIGDAVTAIDGSKWHVLEESASGIDTVVLLSDYNLNSDGSYDIGCSDKTNSTNKCSTMVFDADGTNIYDEEDDNNIGYLIKHVYGPQVIDNLPGTTDVTIPDAYQLSEVNGIRFVPSYGTFYPNFGPDWLITTNYWTKTIQPSFSNVCWLISGTAGTLTFDYTYNSFAGVRPVITTPKTNLLAQ